jgi:hypothetical protein
VTHARDIWWTLDFPNAFVSPGVNSRGELVPSHGASRRRLGDKGLFTGVLFLDLKKAFGTVDHVIPYKLEKYGIQGNSLELFKSYLKTENRFVSQW